MTGKDTLPQLSGVETQRVAIARAWIKKISKQAWVLNVGDYLTMDDSLKVDSCSNRQLYSCSDVALNIQNVYVTSSLNKI